MKFDHANAIRETVVLTVLLLVLSACLGCRTDQRDKVLSTFRVEVGDGNYDLDGVGDKRSFSGDSSYVGFSIQPFAYLEPPQQVIVINK